MKRAVKFVALTYLISGVYSLLYLFFPLKTTVGSLLTALYMFIPFLSAFILQKFLYHEPLKNIFVTFKLSYWYIFALFLPVLWVGGAFLVSLLFKDVSFSSDMSGMIERFRNTLSSEKLELMKKQIKSISPILMLLGMIGQGLLAGVSINAVFAFGEEAGWRGFLNKNLRDILGFYPLSLVIGFIWGLWHLPIIIQGYNYPSHPYAGIFMMILFCILLTPFFIYIVEKTGSVIGAAIMHGSLNGLAGLALVYIKGGSDLIVGLTGLSGFIALLFFNMLLLVYDRYISKESITKGFKKNTD